MNCSRISRSSSPWPGSKSSRWRTSGSLRISTRTTSRTERLSASAITGRLSGSSTSKRTSPSSAAARRASAGAGRPTSPSAPAPPSRSAGSARARSSCRRSTPPGSRPARRRRPAPPCARAVDGDPQLRRLRPRAQQRHLVDRQRLVHGPSGPAARIASGLITASSAASSRRSRSVGAILVHQEADGAAVHAVDRRVECLRRMQRLQHEPVAAERHDHIRLLRRHVAVAARVSALAPPGRPGAAGEKGDLRQACSRLVPCGVPARSVARASETQAASAAAMRRVASGPFRAPGLR